MHTIWKTALSVVGEPQLVRFPRGAELLSVQMQDGFQPVLWARVESSAPLESRVIAMYGTGWPLPADPGEYLGTVQDERGGLVWHFYERPLTSSGEPVLTSKKPTPGLAQQQEVDQCRT
jgi:hypothetical protein